MSEGTDLLSTPSTLLQAMLGSTATFRPGQEEAIGALLDNQNTLVVMPTGAGKSLIYQIAGLLSCPYRKCRTYRTPSMR